MFRRIERYSLRTLLPLALPAIMLALSQNALAQTVRGDERSPFGRLSDWAAGKWLVTDPIGGKFKPERGGLASRSGVQDSGPRQQAPLLSSVSGYMDFHFNNIENQDGVLDFHRFVLLFTHSFTDRIRFVSELELEHAFVELSLIHI